MNLNVLSYWPIGPAILYSWNSAKGVKSGILMAFQLILFREDWRDMEMELIFVYDLYVGGNYT